MKSTKWWSVALAMLLWLPLQQPVFAQSPEDLLGGLPDGESEPAEPEEAEEPTEPEEPAEPDSAASSEEVKVLSASPADSDTGREKKKKKSRQRLQSRKDIIKSVQRRQVLKDMRFELSAAAASSVNDPLYLVFAFQGSGHFYVAEALSVGVGVVYFLGTAPLSGLDDVRRSEQAVPSVFERPNLGLDLEFTWNPLYGKLAFLQDSIVHFDIYLIGGLGAVANFNKTARPAGLFGLGQRFLIADWMTLKWELRDYIFNDNIQSEYGLHSDIQHYALLTVGVSFFIPPTFSYSY